MRAIRIVSADKTNTIVLPPSVGSNKKRRNRRSRSRIKREGSHAFGVLLIVISFTLITCIVMLKYAEVRLQPILGSMATSQARSIASRIISEAIYEEIESDDITYDSLVSFEKMESGAISALTTDIIMMNRLKSRLAVAILNKLSVIEDLILHIPMGNLINGEFLSGRGPKLEIRLLPVGSVTADITNVFTSAGINQTRHQIMLEVTVFISVIMPLSVESTNVDTSICIAETVIVGDVPNMYMQSGEN